MALNQLTSRLLIIASIMSFLWVWSYNYNYTCFQIKIGRLNLLTYMAWVAGLVMVGLWWDYINKNTNWSFSKRFLITGVLWFIAIITLEWIGYNKMNIQLDSDYPGLFGMELMHGPGYLKLYYLTAWALYLYIAF